MCYEYATAKTAPGFELVVYALEDVNPEERDFKHTVFVALIKSVSGRIVDRADVTKYMLDMGESDGTFASMRAEVAPFQSGDARFARVVLWSTLSGSGGITSSSEVLFESTNVLTQALVLHDTSGSARGGWSYRSETSSNIYLLNGYLMWVRRSKVGKARNVNEPFVVDCKLSRRLYRRVGHHFESISRNEAGVRESDMTLIGHDEVAGENDLPLSGAAEDCGR